MERHELSGWLRLTLTPGVGDGTARRLLAAFGLPDAVFAQTQRALAQLCTPAQALALASPPPEFEAQLERTWQWLNEPLAPPIARHILTLGDAAYPPALLQMADPPPMLYAMGTGLQALQAAEPEALALVGTRNPTPQGAADARRFAQHLAASGFVVVSGLALGIDGAAHEGALDGAPADAPAATVAVVGTGLDRVYPARHRELAHHITQRGLILSELPLGAPPLAGHFPKRNRLIAGLARGTLVVEAALASGSLVTARLAVEQGKEVFAIPGSIHAPQSRGCHALIRQGAKLVETAQDILDELPLRRPAAGATPTPSPSPSADNDAPHALLDHLGHGPVSLEALGARTGLPAAQLQAQLLELELDGRVGRLPGGLFQQLARG